MPPAKTATLSFRIDPGVKEGLRIAAAREHRSVSNMVEVLIRTHCETEGIAIPEGAAPLTKSSRGGNRRR